MLYSLPPFGVPMGSAIPIWPRFMSAPEFHAPSVEAMNSLLPAFEFGDIMSANRVGAVYFATQKSLDRHVAVKLFSHAHGNDVHFMRAFRASAASMAGLKHPNLIGLLDSGMVEGMPFIVMEFVPGKSLARSTKGSAINFDQAMSIIGQICEGTAYAHGQTVVHGYLSPLNILLNQQASPKIGNFGLGHGAHTARGVMVPMHFTAPEVLAGETPTKAADLYSIAAIFYELVTGRPYGPDAPPASSIGDCPPTADQVIRRAGASDPQLRGNDANGFLMNLQRATASGVKVEPGPSSDQAPHTDTAEDTGKPEGSKLWLKVVIILLLLVAIQQTISFRNSVAQQRNNPHLTEKNKAAQEAVAAELVKLHPIEEHKQAPPVAPSPGDFPVVVESPLDSLERLRNALREGQRAEMPVGAVAVGDSHYFLVASPMSWADAEVFAEEHGGHLALPDGDPAWRNAGPMRGVSFWVGAARNGAQAMTLVDGRPWDAADVAGDGACVYADEQGAWRTADAAKPMPFVIQWHADGSNPGSLEARLAATGLSLKGSQPSFPLGTLTAGKRRYLPVVRETGWERAHALAQSAGGHLLVISNAEEAAQVQAMAAGLLGLEGLWMGGHLAGDLWVWETGEPWTGIQWLDSRNAVADHAVMVLRPGRGIDAREKSGMASGFIIEWSDDAATHKPPVAQGPSPGEAARELTAKAAELVIAAAKDKEAAHAKNVGKLVWDLDSHIRGLKKSDVEIWAPAAENLKKCVQDNRLRRETVDGAGLQLSAYMAKLANYHIGKTMEIDQQHAARLDTLHASYLVQLGKLITQAKDLGQVRAEAEVSALLEGASNKDAWVASFGIGSGG